MRKLSITAYKWMNRYNNLSAPLKASFWFAVCSILQKGISFITVPIFTRMLSTDQYGVYSLYQSWVSILSVLTTFNLYMGVANTGIVKFEKDSEGFISSLQSLTSFLFLAIWFLYLFNTGLWNRITGLSTFLMQTMFVEIFFGMGLSFWSVKQRCRYNYRLLITITVIMSISSPILGIMAVGLTVYKAEARIISFVFVQVIFGGVLYISNIKDGKKIIDIPYWKYALCMGIPLILHYLSQSILSQSDRIMISKLVGNDKTAIYSVAYNVSSIMLIVTNAINNSFHPYALRKLRDKEYDSLRRSSNLLIIFVGMVTFIVILFGPEVIRVLGGEVYSQAQWIMPPVALSVYFMFLYPLFGNIEMYYGKTKMVMMVSTIGAILNIVLNYVFIPKFGFVAAGYTTLICYIIYCVMHYLSAKKIFVKIGEIREVYDLKFICAFSGTMIIGTMLITMIYVYAVIRWMLIICICILGVINRKKILKMIGEMRNI